MASSQRMCRAGKIVSAYALDRHGVVPAVSKMAFGNRHGCEADHDEIASRSLFAPAFGDIVAEVPADDKIDELGIRIYCDR